MLFTMTLQALCNETASSRLSVLQQHGGEQAHLFEPQGAVEGQGWGVVVIDVEAHDAVGPDMVTAYGVHHTGQGYRPHTLSTQVGARPHAGQLGDAAGRGAPQGSDVGLEGHCPG